MLLAGLGLLLLAAYGPGVGHGFIKDDVAWIAGSEVGSWRDLPSFIFRTQGFYRPLVSASFAIDRLVYGLDPAGYGLTNLGLLILDTLAIAWLASGLGLRPVTAALTSVLWALNVHGINMAVLWLSGRTALLFVLGLTLSAGAFVRRRDAVAGCAALLAMLAREEAVLLPAILTCWAWILSDVTAPWPRLAAALRRGAVAWAALIIYFLLRIQTDATTPGTSAWYYRFTFDPLHVLTNAAEYLDRSATISAAAVLLASLLFRRRPSLAHVPKAHWMLAIVWIGGLFAITIFLPVRSSLYACAPSIAFAWLGAQLIESSAAHRDARHSGWRLAVAATIPVLLLPVYWSRNVRWVELGDLAAQTVRAIQKHASLDPHVDHIIFRDDRTTRRSWRNAYGGLLSEAVRLAIGRPVRVTLEPPEDHDDAAPLRGAEPSNAMVLQLRQGRVERLQ